MKIGRNDPCPCGSGKKYKKCCLGKEQPAPASPPDLGALLAPSAPRPRVAHTPPTPPAPPRQLTPEQQKWQAFWKDFAGQDHAGRVAIFFRMLDDDEMDDELAFEMLQHLHQDVIQSSDRPRFLEFVAALRERRPDVYQEGAHWYLKWALFDALADGQSADVLPLARELAGTAGRDIDAVNRGLDALAYHGQLPALVEALRIGWPEVRASDNVVPWGVTRFAEKGIHYEIYDYLEHTPSGSPDDPALLERMNCFVEEDLNLEYVAQFMGDLTGQGAPAWTVEDFALLPRKKRRRDSDEEEEPPVDQGARNLARLIDQFVGYLRREEGVPYPRGGLVREHLFEYFIRRHEGDLDPQPSMLERAMRPNLKLPPPPPPGHPLCPERVTLDVHFGQLIGFLNSLYHVVAALFELMPAWLRFLETRHLIDAQRRLQTVEELRPLQVTLVGVWEKHTDDPTMYRAVQAWPADAAKGPGER
jgi:hypothetical protein